MRPQELLGELSNVWGRQNMQDTPQANTSNGLELRGTQSMGNWSAGAGPLDSGTGIREEKLGIATRVIGTPP